MSRVWAMPNADTFDVEPIRKFVWKYLQHAKVSIDPFARNKNWATYTNDLNPETAAQFHLEAAEFLKTLVDKGVEADLIIFDPPYSVRQIQECYQQIGRAKFTFKEHEQLGRWNAEKDAIDKLLTRDGIFLHFGWHTNGMGKERGFDIEEVTLVAHGGCRNDTVCMAERRRRMPLFESQRDSVATTQEETPA